MPSSRKEAVTASAPAKVILFGEHFVVYGEPAVVMAIDKRAYATAKLRKDGKIHVASVDMRVSGTFKGAKFEAEKGGARACVKLEPVKNAVQQVLTATNKKAGLDVTISSDIPVSAGLGSSAAVATSTIVATSQLLGVELARDRIFRLAYETERLVHGTPSGIDPAIATYGGTLQFQKGKDFETLKVEANVLLVIGNTEVQRSTKELVATVRHMRDKHRYIVEPVMRTGGRIALLAVEALKKGDLESVGDMMNINHGLLCAVGVSHEALERLVYAARESGALGAKLTGGGGGGCMVALAEEKKLNRVMTAIVQAGGTAFQVRKTDEGVRVEP